MQSSHSASHLVYVWKNRNSRPPATRSMSLPAQQPTNTIKIASWNCRGLHNSILYINHLISSGVDILVLQEHWLWPFELNELQSIDPNFSYTGVCDSRLSPTSTLTRGCGGCAIMWKNSIPATPISTLKSDRICGIQISIPNSDPLSPSSVSTCLVRTSPKRFMMNTSQPSNKPFPRFPYHPHCW